jgi:hypothetical protein
MYETGFVFGIYVMTFRHHVTQMDEDRVPVADVIMVQREQWGNDSTLENEEKSAPAKFEKAILAYNFVDRSRLATGNISGLTSVPSHCDRDHLDGLHFDM